MKCAAIPFGSVCRWALIGTLAGWSGLSAAEKPVAHLKALPPSWAKAMDPMMSEAAMRAVCSELWARHGLYARYWPAGELEGVPVNAYPTFTGFPGPWTHVPHLRIRREGAVLSLYVAENPDRWHRLIAYEVRDLPDEMKVGIWAMTPLEPAPVSRVADVMLEGKPFEPEGRMELIDAVKATEFTRTEDGWRLRAHPATGGRKSHGLKFASGGMLYRKVTGDFDFSLRIVPDENGELPPYPGVIALGGEGRDTCWMGMTIDGNSAFFNYALPQARGGAPATDAGARQQQWFYVPDKDSKGRKDPAVRIFSTWAWLEVIDGADGAAEDLLRLMVREVDLDLTKARPVRRAGEDDLARLRELRRWTLSLEPGKIHAASREVDALLMRNPTCPSAWRVAARCGAMLAFQDLCSPMHERGRYLAIPLGHLLTARRMAPAGNDDERLDEAWVMLACGYPRAAMEVVGRLDPSRLDTPEVRAIRMYATRDYRLVPGEAIGKAEPIEQAAWMWATGECARWDLRGDWGLDLARNSRIVPVFPFRYISGNRGWFDVMARMAPVAVARDCSDLLTLDALPRRTRRAFVERLGQAVVGDLDLGDDPDKAAETVAEHVFADGTLRWGEALDALLELYATIERADTGASVVDGPDGLELRTLPAAAVADMQRAVLVRCLWRQCATFRQVFYPPKSVHPAVVAEHLKKAGLPHAEMFDGFAAWIDRDIPKAKKRFASLMAGPLGSVQMDAFVRECVHDDVLDELTLEQLLERAIPPGAWLRSWSIASWPNRFHRSFVVLAQLWSDPWDFQGYWGRAWHDLRTRYGWEGIQRMPYHVGLLSKMAQLEVEYDRRDKAAVFYDKALEIWPDWTEAHRELIDLYICLPDADGVIRRTRAAIGACGVDENLAWPAAEAARFMALNGYPREAMEFAEYAMKFPNATTLDAVAHALASNGRKDEGETAILSACSDYGCEYSIMLRYYFMWDYPTEHVIEATKPLREDWEPAGLNHVIFAMVRRDFQEVLDRTQRIDDTGKALYRLYALAALGKRQGREEAARYLQKSNRKLYPFVHYVTGRSDQNQAIRQARTPWAKRLLYFLFAMEMEAVGDYETAKLFHEKLLLNEVKEPRYDIMSLSKYYARRLEEEIEKKQR